MTFQWYVLRTGIGKEHDVVAAVEGAKLRGQFQQTIARAVIPRDAKGTLLYPGYIIAELDLCPGVSEFICSLPGVVYFVTGGSFERFSGSVDQREVSSKPTPLSASEIEKILRQPGTGV